MHARPGYGLLGALVATAVLVLVPRPAQAQDAPPAQAGASMAPASQANWKLARNRHDIQVYLSPWPDSTIKAVKTVMTVPEGIQRVSAVLQDAPLRARWESYCASAQVYKRLGADSALWYVRFDPPWPVSNRDVLSRVHWSTDPGSGVVRITAVATAGAMPTQKGYVRITQSTSLWTLTPLADGGTRIVAESHSEPGSPLPAWLINAHLVSSPYKSFKRLRQLLGQGSTAKAGE